MTKGEFVNFAASLELLLLALNAGSWKRPLDICEYEPDICTHSHTAMYLCVGYSGTLSLLPSPVYFLNLLLLLFYLQIPGVYNIFFFPGVFYYFNSVLNPILYSLMSKRFRRGFSDIKRSLVNRYVLYLHTRYVEQKNGEKPNPR